MVMHARKYPRHNDGYYDRNQAHPFEDKYPSKSHSGGGGSYYDRYGDRSSKESPSYNRLRDDSPGRPSPRYQNKSSYKDRAKERIDKDDRRRRHSRQRRGSNNSPGDSRLNHHHNSRSDCDRHGAAAKPAFKSLESLKSTEPKDPKTEQIQKSALRVSGDWSEHRSSSGKKYYYNCKSEVSQWEKPKDWIELSANLGRPTENLGGRSKDRNGRDSRHVLPSASSTKSSDDRYKHSTGGGGGGGGGQSMVVSGNHRGHYPPSTSAAASSASSSYGSSNNPGVYSSPASDHHHRHSHHPPHRDGEHRDRSDHLRKAWSIPVSTSRDGYGEYSSGRDGGGSCMAAAASSSNRDSGLQRIPVVCRSSSLPEGPNNHGSGGGSGGVGLHRSSSGRGSIGAGGSNRGDDHRHGDNHHHHLPHPAQHHPHHPSHHHHQHHHKGSAAAFNGARHPGDLSRNDNEDSRQTEDMDISPGSTPTGSRPNSNVGTPVSSLNNASSMTSSLAGANLSMGNDLTQQAIQTLQKLQAALMAQQHQLEQRQHTNTTVNQSPAPDATPPHQPYLSPHVNSTSVHASGGRPASLSHQVSTATDEDSRGGRESPRSDRSVRSSRRGSPTPSVASSQSVSLSGSSLSAANKKQDSVQLTPSLSNYYNDALIEHCSNLQADQAERQANRYGEEAHSVGTLHCTQVSVDLKRARSLVRIAEIQATLQEQRILFLRQQTRDLENMRSQNSFMPAQHDT